MSLDILFFMKAWDVPGRCGGPIPHRIKELAQWRREAPRPEQGSKYISFVRANRRISEMPL
jgi:hypothetical protein